MSNLYTLDIFTKVINNEVISNSVSFDGHFFLSLKSCFNSRIKPLFQSNKRKNKEKNIVVVTGSNYAISHLFYEFAKWGYDISKTFVWKLAFDKLTLYIDDKELDFCTEQFLKGTQKIGSKSFNIMKKCINKERKNKRAFDNLFPRLTDAEYKICVQDGVYRGGLLKLEPEAEEVEKNENIICIDYNSHYLNSAKNRMPIGHGYHLDSSSFEFYFPDEKYFDIITLELDCILIPGGLAMHSTFNYEKQALEYHEKINGIISVNSIDLLSYFDNYSIDDMKILSIYRFNTLPNIFDSSARLLYWLKNKFGGSYKQLAVAGIGKFGSNKVVKLNSFTYNKTSLLLDIEEIREEFDKDKYIPVAIAVNAYARREMSKLYHKIKNDITLLYTATDAFYFKPKPTFNKNKLDIGTKLGQLKIQFIKQATFFKPNWYRIITVDNEIIFKLAGIDTEKIIKPFNLLNVKKGDKFKYLSPQLIIGGIAELLTETVL